MFQRLKKFLKSKRAVGSVATAIKVGTACVLGAAILVGGVALTNDVILPNTSDKVASIAAYEGGEVGDSVGGVEPVSVPTITTFEFTISSYADVDEKYTYTAEEGMTWAEWCDSDYCPEMAGEKVLGINGEGYIVEGNLISFDFYGNDQIMPSYDYILYENPATGGSND